MPDGRLGLIDYGQLKKMDLKHRLIYAKFIIALADNNEVIFFRDIFALRFAWAVHSISRYLRPQKYLVFFH